MTETPSARWKELEAIPQDCPACNPETAVTEPLCYQCEHDLETLKPQQEEE